MIPSKTRLAHAMLALVAGWTMAMLATLPFQAAMCLRNSDGDMHLFRQMMPLVLLIWCVWTLGLALVGWLLFALPLVLLVKPRWIYLRSRWLMAACALVTLATTTIKFDIWKLLRPHLPIDRYNFALYTIFAMTYSVATAAVYAWLAGRRLSRQRSIDPAIRN